MNWRRPSIVLATFLVGSLVAAPQQVSAQAQYETVAGKSKPVYEESIHEEYRVDTKWGSIYGLVERPVVPKGVKVPVILTYSPYNADSGPSSAQVTTHRDATNTYFVPRGYARAHFDLVGTNGSGGCYDYGGIRERETGAAVVDFLGSQDWSNGRVGMIGGSYDGTTQWAAAVETPKHLTTIVPQVAIGRWYDYAFGQGIRFYSGFGTPYLFDYGYGFIPPSHSSPPDPEAAQDHFRPCERLKHNERAFLPDPVYDGFWEERDYLSRIGNVRASVMIEGSWVDYNVHPINSYEMWAGLPDDHPKRFVMGQQGHAGSRHPDNQNVRHAWFDYWLLGLDTGIMDIAPVDSITNSGRFQSEAWPPPGTKVRGLELTTVVGKGELVLSDAEQASWMDDNPSLDERQVFNGLGGDADLIFLTEPLEKKMRIAGVPRLRVEVVTDMENTWLTPVLFAQSPQGSIRFITRGLLNARNRFGERSSIPLAPGDPWRGEVRFQPTDFLVAEEARLGLAVMSMNNSEALYWSGMPATNILNLDDYGSLLLPIAPH